MAKRRVLILTSSLNGSAAVYIPSLVGDQGFDIVGVIRTKGVSSRRKRRVARKLRKTMKIGIVGAINGMRIREWFRPKDAPNLKDLCVGFSIPFFECHFTASDETRAHFRELDADLGLSLGNGYIPKSVYSLPRCGMINVHTEILPRFQGAQSVVWPIYERTYETGFTIHQINRRIDCGRILLVQSRPIEFYPTLRETVERNLYETRRRVPQALCEVVNNYERCRERAQLQTVGCSYTTPTFRQFVRMLRLNREMYKQSCQ